MCTLSYVIPAKTAAWLNPFTLYKQESPSRDGLQENDSVDKSMTFHVHADQQNGNFSDETAEDDDDFEEDDDVNLSDDEIDVVDDNKNFPLKW